MRPYSRVRLLRFRYGAYLSKEQVAEHVRPHPESLALINAWLVHHGIRSSSISPTHGGGWLTVSDVLVSQANQLLGATYQLYRNVKTNETIIRTVGYRLPTALHAHIQTVAPTTNFPSRRVNRQTPRRRSFGNAQAQAASGKLVTAPSSRNNGIWPGFLQWMYQTSEYVPAAVDQNRLAVIGFDNEFPSQADLTKFTTVLAKRALGATFTVAPFNGGVDNPDLPPSSQANGDVQYAATMAFPTPLVFYSIGGASEWEPNGQPIAQDRYLAWLHQILNQPDFVIPQTISISYGLYEPEIPFQYSWAVCDLFKQFGARGVSVLVASGSQGVGHGDCQDAHGDVHFIPEFPASCKCGVLSPFQALDESKNKSLTRPPWFCRSLCHCRRRHCWQPRGRGEPLRRRLLGPLSAAEVPVRCGERLPRRTHRTRRQS